MAYTHEQWERWKRKHPDKWKARAQKIAKAHKGKKLSPEHRAAIAKAMRGRKLSLSQKKKIAEGVKKARATKKPGKSYQIIRKSAVFEKKPLLYTAGLIAVALIIAFGLTNLGLFVQEDWTKQWEAMKDITVDNNIEYVTTHIVFGLYKPKNCSEGIYITDGVNDIPFEILNPIYDENGLCSEVDVKFKNLIYAPVGLEIEFVEPTPADGAVLNKNWFEVKVLTTEGTNFTLIEWERDGVSNTDVMTGFGTEWTYNLTNLEDGTYRYRVLATNVTGGMEATDYRRVVIAAKEFIETPTPIRNVTKGAQTIPPSENLTENISAAENITHAENVSGNVTGQNLTTPKKSVIEGAKLQNETEATAGVIIPAQRITYYIYYGKKPVEGLTQITFVYPTPLNNTQIEQSWIFVNVTTNADANITILEWAKDNESIKTELMSGSGKNFWFNLTNLSEGNYSFAAVAQDSDGKAVKTEKRFIEIVPKMLVTNKTFVINPVVKDIFGNEIEIAIDVKEKIGKVVRKKVEEKIETTTQKKVQKELFEVTEGRYEIKITLMETPIKKIEYTDFYVNKNVTDTVEIDDVPENIQTPKEVSRWDEVYAIRPLINEPAQVTVTAKGNTLFKCKDWNFSERVCYGAWEKYASLTPGEDYTITIGSDDPAFGEAGKGTGGAILNSSSGYNLVTDNLTCYNISTSGTYHWIKNGESYENLILTFNQDNVPDTDQAIDSSGNGFLVWKGSNFGSIDSADPTWTSSGKIGGAYSFDGLNDYLISPNISESPLDLNVLTMEAWIYLPTTWDSTKTNAMMIIQAPGQYNMWFPANSGRLRVADDRGEYIDSNKNSWSPGWYHIVGILDDVNDIKKIYINGALDNTDTTAFGIDKSCYGYAHCDLFIGARNGNPNVDDDADSYYFNGTIDEVRIYPRVLSADEVNAHYNLEYNKIVANETSLNDRWRCDIVPTTSIGSSSSLTIERSNLLLVNGRPNQTNPTLVYENGNYTCYNQSTSDPDGAGINNVFSWYADGEPLEVLTLSFDVNKSGEIATSMSIHDYSGNNNSVLLSPRIYTGHTGNVNITFYSVGLPFSFVDPVVIAQPHSYEGEHTSVVRIRNVGHNSFEMRIQEAPNLDDNAHANEEVAYFVIERGAWYLPTKPENESAFIQADYVGTSATVGQGITNVWRTVNYTEGFCNETMCYYPEVISQIQTIYDRHFAKTREKDVDQSYRFNVSLEEEEASVGYHGPEIIGFVAAKNSFGDITPDPYGPGSSYYALYEFGDKTSVTDAWSTINYVNDYGGTVTYIQLAGIKTYNGANNCELRKNALTSTGFDVKVEEDTTSDPETSHTGEDVSYFAFSPPTLGNQKRFMLKPPKTVSGKVGNALEFDGANDYLLIKDSPSMRFRHNFTVEGWVKVLKDDSVGRTIFLKNSNLSNFDIKITVSNSSLDCTIVNQSGAQKSATYNYGWGSAGTFYNQWKHFACVWNGTWLGVYVNGSLRTDSPHESYEDTTGFGGLMEINASSYIGASRTASGSFDSFLNADLDEFRVYPRALTQEQIRAHYNLEYNKIVSSVANDINKLVCAVTPNDKVTIGDALNNTPIQIISVNITPSNPSTEDDLGCYFNITDPSAQWIKANVTWYNDTAHITGYDSTGVDCISGYTCYATTNLQSEATNKGDNITCQVTAYNNYGDTASKNGTVQINNSCPYWDPPLEDQTAQKGIMFRYDANATDPDNDTLTYWINDTSFTINTSTGEINKTFANYGNYTVRMNATDGSCSITATFTIEVKKAAGDLCNLSSECGSGYCRHDWDWDGPKKICAIDAISCSRSNSTGNYGNISSEPLFSTNIVDPDNTTISVEPFYKCRKGHWSEDPYSHYIDKSTYAEFTFDKAGYNDSARIRINKTAVVSKSTMEISGYLSNPWIDWCDKSYFMTGNDDILYVGTTKANDTIFIYWLEYRETQEPTARNWTYKISKSTDGGVTWTDPITVYDPPLTNYHYFAPFLIAPNDTTLFMVFGNDVNLSLVKSTDGGQTWGSPILVDDLGSNYDIYYGIYFNGMPIIAFNRGNVRISNTTDGGNSFGKAITLMRNQYEAEGLNPVLAEHNGTLYLIANKYDYPYGTVLFTSDDGYSWSYAQDLPNSDKSVQPYIAWKGDRLYLLENRGPKHNITIRYSDDNGSTWSTPIQVYARSDRKLNWPALFINGSDFYVVLETQLVPCYYLHSSDNGTTWGAAIKLRDSNAFTLTKARQYAIFYNNSFMIAGKDLDSSGYIKYVLLSENAIQKYPENVTVDLGADGINEFTYTGNLSEQDSPMNVTLTGNLTQLADSCTCPGCTDDGTYCDIAINVSVAGRGIVTIDDLTVTYTVPMADLVPVEVNYTPIGPLDQDSISVNVTIKNQGDKNATQFNVSLYIDGSKVGENTITNLSAGASTTITFSNIWTAQSGMHQIKVVVDSAGEVDESNETNNEKTEMIGVDWPMFHQTVEHWGYSSVTSLPDTSYVVWDFTAGARIGEISIANGIVYASSDDAHLYALNLTTGEEIWNYSTGTYTRSAPVVYDGKVYFSSSSRFFALNASTGEHIWNVSVSSYATSAAVSDGIVYFANNTYMLAHNASNGSKIWSYSPSSYWIYSSPAVYDGKVYFGSLDKKVYALDAKTGSHIWNYSTSLDVYSSPTIYNGILYIGSNDDHLYALNASTGAHIWNYSTGDDIRSTPAAHNDVVFFGSEDNYVYALNATNGSLIWNFYTADDIHSSPAVADGKVYIGSFDNKFYALNESTGNEIWSYTTGGDIRFSSAAVGYDGSKSYVLIGSDDYKLYAFGKQPPTVTNVQIQSDYNFTLDDLNCTGTFSGGANAGNSYYRWYTNQSGSWVQIPGQTSQILDSDITNESAWYICEITPSDGSENGTAVNSSAVQITPLSTAASYSGTFNEAGNMTVASGGTLSLGSSTITVSGQVAVSGTFNGGTGEHSFGSLTINSGGTYTATNSTTAITSSKAGSISLDIQGGTFTHNNGTIDFTGSSDQKIQAAVGSTVSFYNLYSNNTDTDVGLHLGSTFDKDLIVENNFIISSGSYVSVAGSFNQIINITGDLTISGTWINYGDTWDDDIYAGSLTISSGGTYDATSGTTFVKGSWNSTGGTFLHNSGTVEFAEFSADGTLDGGPEFYDVVFDTGSYTLDAYNFTGDSSGSRMLLKSGTLNIICAAAGCAGDSAMNYTQTGGLLTHPGGPPYEQLYSYFVNITGGTFTPHWFSYYGNVSVTGGTITGGVWQAKGDYQTFYTTQTIDATFYVNGPNTYLELLSDVNVDDHLIYVYDNDVTLDLNGHSLSTTGHLRVTELYGGGHTQRLVTPSGSSISAGNVYIGLVGGGNGAILGTLNTDWNLTVNGNVIVDGTAGGVLNLPDASGFVNISGIVKATNGGIINGTSNGNYYFGALNLSAGTYDATSGTTTITSEDSTGFAFDCDGTFIHNNGLIEITTPATTRIDAVCTGNIYNLKINQTASGYSVWSTGNNRYEGDIIVSSGTYTNYGYWNMVDRNAIVNGTGTLQSWNNEFRILNNLTIESGANATVTGTGYFNVSGYANISGEYYGNTEDDYFGSIRINPGGIFNASSGKTIVTSESPDNFRIRNLGTFNHNSGLVESVFGGASYIDMGGDALYDAKLCGGHLVLYGNDLVVEHNLTVGGCANGLNPSGSGYDIKVGNNLTIESGSLLVLGRAGSTLNVTNDALVEGEVKGADYTGDTYLGSLILEPGGLFETTSGTLTFTQDKNSIISGNFTIGSSSGIVINITVNGTKYSLNGTSVQLHSYFDVPDDPSGAINIGKYVNMSNLSVDSVAFLNVSYLDSDIVGFTEISLAMWKYDTSWSKESDTGVETAENYVWANITEFSLFAPMGSRATQVFVWDSEQDEETQAESNDPLILTNEIVTFYANFTSDGNRLGNVYWRTGDLGALYSVKTIDYDGDGLRDEFVVGESGDILWYNSSGSQIDSNAAPVGVVYDAHVFDADNDGIEDEVVIADSAGYVRVFNESGDEVWSFGDFGSAYSIAVGDLDEDGVEDDFIVGAYIGSYAVMAFNTSDGGQSWENMWNETSPASIPYEVQAVSISGGANNLVGVADWYGGSVIVYYSQNGTVVFDTGDLGTTQSFTFIDIDHDGKKDEVAMGEAGELRVFDENGNSLFVKTEPLSFIWEIEAVDWDEDGYEDDILISDRGYVWVFNESGGLLGSWVEPDNNRIPSPSQFYSMAFGDVDGDGENEVIVGGSSWVVWVLNKSFDIEGRFDISRPSLDNYVYGAAGDNPGIAITPLDINDDGSKEWALAELQGYLTVMENARCDITFNDTGITDQMSWNETTGLWEYRRTFNETGFNKSIRDKKVYEWNVTCYKGKYDYASSPIKNVTVNLTDTSLDAFDQEQDEETNPESNDPVIYRGEVTYFYANYTDEDNKVSATEEYLSPIFQGDYGSDHWAVEWADLDHDGVKDELIVGEYGDIRAFNSSGSLLYSNTQPYYYIYEIEVGDLDNDGWYDDIVLTDYGGYLYVLNETLDVIFQFGDFGIGYDVVIGDVDGDGLEDDFVVSGKINGGTTHGIMVWNTSDGVTWNNLWNSTAPGGAVYEVNIANLSGEPNRILSADVGGYGRVFFAENGTEICNTGDVGYVRSGSFIDLDNDGKEDEIVLGEDGELRAFDENCVSQWTKYEPDGAIYALRVTDLDDDGYVDDTIAAGRWTVWAFDQAGSLIWRFDDPADYTYTIQIGDINNDGDDEILIGGTDDTIYVLNKTGSLLGKHYMGDEKCCAYRNIGSTIGQGSGIAISGVDSITNNLKIAGVMDDHGFKIFDTSTKCTIRFDGGEETKMYYNKTSGLYYYNRSFSTIGTKTWNITCIGKNYETQIKTGTVNITNRIPTHDNPILNATDHPLNRTTANLTCYPQNLSDPDGDDVWPIFSWYKNNERYYNLYLPFNTNTTSTDAGAVKDYSGGDITVQLGGGDSNKVPIWKDNGVLGGAYQFGDAYTANATIKIFDDDKLDTGDYFTFEGWYKFYNLTFRGDIYFYNRHAQSNTQGFHIIYRSGTGSNARMAYQYCNGTKYKTLFSNYLSWNTNEWYHVAFVHDNVAKTVKFYRNGQLVGTATYTDDALPVTSGNAYLGGYQGDFRFRGEIDEVRIYNRTLSQEEIYQHYIEGSNKLNTSVIVSDETTKGDEWICEVTPNDGWDDGAPKNSSPLTIENSPISIENVLVEDDVEFPYDEIDLVGGGTKFVHCNATVIDPDTPSDFNSTSPIGRLYFFMQNTSKALAIWHMDEGSGSDVKDSINGNDGVVYAPDWVAGKFNWSLNLSANNSHIRIPDSDNLDSGDEFTFEIWVKFNSLDAQYDTLYNRRGQSGTAGFHWIYINPDATNPRIVYQYANGSHFKALHSDYLSWNLGKWYHIAVVHNNTNKSVAFYRNGESVGLRTYTDDALPVTAGVAYIGTYNNNSVGTYNLDGIVDEVAIYNRSKTPEEILNDYLTPDPTPYDCSDDNNYCYVNSSCSWLSIKNSTAQYVECGFDMWFNARNSSNLGWTCNITVWDNSLTTANENDTTDVNQLLAVGTPNVVGFGAMGVGETSSTDVNASLWNYGNVRIDLSLNGSSMNCDVGSIAVSYLHYNCTHFDQDYSNMQPLSSTLTSDYCSEFDLDKNSTSTAEPPLPPFKNIAWKIQIPPAVSGNCQGTIWFAAVAG